jgi:hypothetical protein
MRPRITSGFSGSINLKTLPLASPFAASEPIESPSRSEILEFPSFDRLDDGLDEAT